MGSLKTSALPVRVKRCINPVFHFQQSGRAASSSRPRPLPGKHGPAASWEGVGMLLPEDVAHSAAGDDLQAPAALPHPEGDL